MGTSPKSSGSAPDSPRWGKRRLAVASVKQTTRLKYFAQVRGVAHAIEFASRLKIAVGKRREQGPRIIEDKKDTSSSDDESEEDDWLGTSGRKGSIKSSKSNKSDPMISNSAVTTGRRLSNAPAEYRPKAEQQRHSKE